MNVTLRWEQKIFASISASFGGNFRKPKILHFPRMRNKHCSLGCHPSVVVTLLEKERSFRLFLAFHWRKFKQASRFALSTMRTHYALWSPILFMFLWNPGNSLSIMKSDMCYIPTEPWKLTRLYEVRFVSIEFCELTRIYGVRCRLYFYGILRTHLTSCS